MAVPVTDMIVSTAEDGVVAETTSIKDPNLDMAQSGVNNVLLEIISRFSGATYAGVATPETNPGTPLLKVFYLTTTAGEYTNFSNLTAESGKLTVLLYNGSTWEKQVLDLPASGGGGSTVKVVQATGTSTTDVMSQKSVTDELGKRQMAPTTVGEIGQVLTQTGPNAEDVSWQTPSGGGGTSVTVVQTTGDSTTSVMSQKGVTDGFDKHKLSLMKLGVDVKSIIGQSYVGYIHPYESTDLSKGFRVSRDKNYNFKLFKVIPGLSYTLENSAYAVFLKYFDIDYPERIQACDGEVWAESNDGDHIAPNDAEYYYVFDLGNKTKINGIPVSEYDNIRYIGNLTKHVTTIAELENKVDQYIFGFEIEGVKNTSKIIEGPFASGSVILYYNKGDVPATIGGYIDTGGSEDILRYLPAGEYRFITLYKEYTRLYIFSGYGDYKANVSKISTTDRIIHSEVESSIISPFNNNNFNIGLSPFQKFGTVGDSLTVGEWQEEGGETINRRDLKNSWGQHIARKHGNKCLNFGFAGATCKSFYDSDLHGINELKTEEYKCQAYIISIGTNDTSDIGTIDDVNWDDMTQNADTFYGNYAKIIQAIKEYAPQAILFCATIPYPRNSETKNGAIADIVKSCNMEGVFLIDLDSEKYNALYSSTEVYGFYYNGHYNAAGYAVYGNIVDAAVGEVLFEQNTNPVVRNMSGIPYGEGEILE